MTTTGATSYVGPQPDLTVGMACYDDFDGVYFTIRALHMMHLPVMDRIEVIVVDNNPGSEHGKMSKDVIGWMRTRERAYATLAPIIRKEEFAIVQLAAKTFGDVDRIREWAGELSKDDGKAFLRKCFHESFYGPITPQWFLSKFGGDILRWQGFSDSLQWNVLAARYIAAPEATGTSQPRNRVFAEAAGKAVLCMDSHVLIEGGALRKLLDYYQYQRESKCLYSGVMLYDDLINYSSRFDDVWRSEMWGTWGSDQEVRDPAEKEFEIPGQGLGLFTCNKHAWLGFNPKFRGFGGEEMYVHTKYRQAGHRCLCLPFLRWVHRFGRPRGVPYPLTTWHKVRNYVIGHAELGLPLDRVHKQFVLGVNEDGTPARPDPRTGQPTQLIPDHEWAMLTADPLNPPEWPPGVPLQQPAQQQQAAAGAAPAPQTVVVSQGGGGGCGACPSTAKALNDPKATLEDLYTIASQNPSDINEHAAKLRELASQCDVVVEFGMRHGVSTVALLAGMAGQTKQKNRQIKFRSYGNPDAIVGALKERQGACDFVYQQGDSLTTEIPADTDLLFLDTVHTADHLWKELVKHAPHVKRWIALHDTQVYGEHGEGGGPGLLPALRRWMKDHAEWSVFYHSERNHGFTVISRDQRDKPKLPGKITMAANFAKALKDHVMDGMRKVSLEVLEQRLEICTMCDQRRDDRCGVCSCYLNEKCSWRTSYCPLGKWSEAEEAGATAPSTK